MKRGIRATILGIALLVTALGRGADQPTSGNAESKAISAILTPENASVPLGSPILVSFVVTNSSEADAIVDLSATAFDCFEVKGPDSEPLPYVGFMGQVMSRQATVKAGSTTTIEKGLDLTDKYVFAKAGRYTVRFKNFSGDIPASNTITVDVSPGKLTELDEAVLRLLPVRPSGWFVTKSPRGQSGVAPSGRARVKGYEAHICRNYMMGEALYVWLAKAEAGVNPDQDPPMKSGYLGRANGLYVYVAEASKTPALWPKAVAEISAALGIHKE